MVLIGMIVMLLVVSTSDDITRCDSSETRWNLLVHEQVLKAVDDLIALIAWPLFGTGSSTSVRMFRHLMDWLHNYVFLRVVFHMTVNKLCFESKVILFFLLSFLLLRWLWFIFVFSICVSLTGQLGCLLHLAFYRAVLVEKFARCRRLRLLFSRWPFQSYALCDRVSDLFWLSGGDLIRFLPSFLSHWQ